MNNQDSPDPVLNYDRGRGIFSPTDRKYLIGETEYENRQDKYERRKAIRQRVKDGIIDLHFLVYIDDDERQKILSELSPGNLKNGIGRLVGFAYRALNGDLTEIERSIGTGLTGVMGPLARHDVTVEIDVEHAHDVDEIEERFRKGERLSAAEKGILLEEGRITEEDLPDLKRPENPLMREPRPMTPQRSTEGKENKRDHVPPDPSELISEESDSDSDE